MDRLAGAIVLIAVLACCMPTAGVTTPSPTAVATVSAAAATPAARLTSTPVTPATQGPARTPRVGGCTSAQATSRQLLDRYFALTTSGDTGAVLDCFARVYRDKGDMEFSANRWANAGPLSRLSVRYLDRVNGCDRFATQYQFVTPDPGWPGGFSIFLTVGLEAGVMRIFDGGTALAAPEYTLVACR